MTIRQKLEIIQNTSGLTQTELAQKFKVSFVAFNNWWNEKSIPRKKNKKLIDELFLEITGQKIIPEEEIVAKKQILYNKLSKHKNIIKEILDNSDIKNQFILKLTYNSNSIEGSTLTEADTAAILFDNSAISNKSLTEHLEAKNHQTALSYLFDYIFGGGEINEDFILKLHSVLMSGIISDAGFYRNHGARIVGVNLPTANYISISKLMKDIVSLVNKKNNDIISLSTKIHSRFEQIHPFSDGNGRIGRLIMNAMLLKENLPPAIIEQKQKRLYYNYLYKAQTKDDQSQLESFICDSILEGLKILERED